MKKPIPVKTNLAFVGIDPGQQGAVSCININQNAIVSYDMPLLPQKGIDGMEIFSLMKILKHSCNNIFCVLEKAQPMPNQGSVGIFNYGIGYGKILSALEINKIPFQEVHPLKWKKEFGITTKSRTGTKITPAEKKQLSLKVAMQLFPEQAESFHTKKGRLLDGIVESLLLAEYARRIYKAK